MNTKTMRLPPRRLVTPAKRKEKDDFDLEPFKASKPSKPVTPQAGSEKAVAAQLDSSNQLLAGYLAHEYITKGTLFGQPYDPAQSQAAPVQGTESRKLKSDDRSEGEVQKYVEVANLLKTDGAHIPGIVNPTQLARFLKI
ncbi:hypothetical protein SLEP1_g801 [Rubroshorea leprosula]|uniref:Uncharacterized protein n=1 Tax=Rubroshorea leprosula TaxID=152421 RepID=A0AAV5HBR4_9ROSI|nr:hypothetical protein SLEP1_g801 [Rubroshorea leprosula]